MAELVLYHHAQGLTKGVKAFADELRRAGHTVHVPDLYEGHTFDTQDEGLAYAKRTGFGTIMERGLTAVEGLGGALVYAGFSLGVMPAQRLAQTRAGARGALLLHACVPVS
jgi:esterase/lipase